MSKSESKVRLLASDVLASMDEVKVKDFDAYFTKGVTKEGLYLIWRDAVTANGLCRFLHSKGSVKDCQSSFSMFKIFTTHFPKEEFPSFMNTIMQDWDSLKKHLAATTTWKEFSVYPELGWLNYNMPSVLTWYCALDTKVDNNYTIWCNAIITNKLSKFINTEGSVKEVTSADTIFNKFVRYYPKEEFPVFMNVIMKEWLTIKSYMTNNNIWKEFKPYPDLDWLNYVLTHILTWYSDYKDKIVQLKELKVSKVSNDKVLTPNNNTINLNSSVQLGKVQEFNKPGVTYVNGKKYMPSGKLNMVYEEDWLEALKMGDLDRAESISDILKSKSVNYEFSRNMVMTLFKE